jgi:hypothetical protein
MMIGDENGDDSVSVEHLFTKANANPNPGTTDHTGVGGELPQKVRGGGGFSGLNTKPTIPIHSIYQLGFPNNYFGLDAMNIPREIISGDTVSGIFHHIY